MSRTGIRAALGVALVLMQGMGAIGQSPSPGANLGLLSDAPRFHAPFSARSTLTVIQRTDNGGQWQRTLTTTQFRDSRGRVRIEYGVAVDSGPRELVLLAPNPYAPRERLFLIDDVEKLIEWAHDYLLFQRTFNASNLFSLPTDVRRFTVFLAANVHDPATAGILDNLGNRTIAGLEVTGLRFTAHGSGEVDERWESADLGVVVYARHIDARTEIEYLLRDVRRDEPDQELFVMPAGYRYQHDSVWVWDSPGAEFRRLGR